MDGRKPTLPARLNADPGKAASGIAQLVLTLVELIRQLLERETIRRMDRGTLSLAEVERLGTAFMLMQEKIAELRDLFGLTEEDLNIDLGPLGRLL
jgi:hypothetical protein